MISMKQFGYIVAVISLLLHMANGEVTITATEQMDSEAIQSAIDKLPKPRQYYATVRLIGCFTVSKTIMLPDYTRLNLEEAELHLSKGASCDVIANADQKNGNHHIEVTGGRIDGHGKEQSKKESHGLSFCRVNQLRITGVEVSDCSGDGIRISGGGSKTCLTFVSSVIAKGNRGSGVNIMWASRQVVVSDVATSDNGKFGVRSDHSEGSYSNIVADRNLDVGIFIRNIFGGSYVNLTASRNGGIGILVQGMVMSLGSNWSSHNNSASQPGKYSEIFFTADDSLSYGRTADTAITNICAGNYREYGEATAKHAIEVEQLWKDQEAKYKNLKLSQMVLSPTLDAESVMPKD